MSTPVDMRRNMMCSRVESSMDLVKQYIKSLPTQDVIKILTPVKARLLSDDTILHINTL